MNSTIGSERGVLAEIERLFAPFRSPQTCPSPCTSQKASQERDQKDALNYERISAFELPEPYRTLLAHEHHMTVTVEAHHGSLVDVRVLARHQEGDSYSRKIVLVARQGSRAGQVVQFGLVRIDFSQVSAEVQQAIRAENTPVGRVLIEHGVLRRVEPRAYLRIEPSLEQWSWFGLPPQTGVSFYGRLVVIYCNNQPALEALEIVVPEEGFTAST